MAGFNDCHETPCVFMVDSYEAAQPALPGRAAADRLFPEERGRNFILQSDVHLRISENCTAITPPTRSFRMVELLN